MTPGRPASRPRVPVIALTGYLGAGKTTLLNHLLRTPGARLGCVINDFGDINVDAALVSGEVDEPASVAGGCLCCMPDAGGLETALERLTAARADLDAILIEASGLAEPPNLVRLLRSAASRRVRYAGLIDVVDAVNDARTIGGAPPARYGAATLVVVAKTDLLDAGERRRALARVAGRARARNPRALVVEADHGRIDPLLVMDVAQEAAPPGELPLAELTRTARAEAHGGHRHAHADCLTVPAALPVSPGALADLLERPPVDAYRLKGVLDVAGSAGRPGPPEPSDGARRVVVNVVAGQVHLETARPARPARPAEPGLVAIGTRLGDDVRAALEEALRPAREPPSPSDLARLDRIRRRSRGI
ncbi:CobW family GTP-binding protein [Actinomyces israelii]|uniref:CobW family GTP-binding protein n=1 Tax=Actinomyces israelii TaxID=1659 RepID=UPI0025544241|nr:GTP-binding protein [Actinomyces israelii]WKR21265.1 P-loop guanosine triphosphatase YjiA [Actinomyces israelii]